MDLVSRSPEREGRWIEVLRRPDGFYSFRVGPSHGTAPSGIYDTPEHAMAEGLSSTQWLRPYDAMTVNERLAVSGLMDAFDEAIRDGDRALVLELLGRVHLDPDQAARVLDELLGHGPPNR